MFFSAWNTVQDVMRIAKAAGNLVHCTSSFDEWRSKKADEVQPAELKRILDKKKELKDALKCYLLLLAIKKSKEFDDLCKPTDDSILTRLINHHTSYFTFGKATSTHTFLNDIATVKLFGNAALAAAVEKVMSGSLA